MLRAASNGGGAAMDTDMNDDYATHGIKRRAEDDLENEQRFAKRFSRLNLERTGRAYVPIQPAPSSTSEPPPTPQQQQNGELADNGANGDIMQVDDTRDRVYIYNLDAELADATAQDEPVVFLPDIEKSLSKVPRALVRGFADEAEDAKGREVVLYRPPSENAMGLEQDRARQTRGESKARARQLQAAERRANGIGSWGEGRGPSSSLNLGGQRNRDPDAMEVA